MSNIRDLETKYLAREGLKRSTLIYPLVRSTQIDWVYAPFSLIEAVQQAITHLRDACTSEQSSGMPHTEMVARRVGVIDYHPPQETPATPQQAAS